MMDGAGHFMAVRKVYERQRGGKEREEGKEGHREETENRYNHQEPKTFK